MRTVYREKRYYCGEYLDVYIYPTYRQGRSRGKRSKPDPPPLKRNSISGIERKSSSVSSTRTLRRTTSKSI